MRSRTRVGVDASRYVALFVGALTLASAVRAGETITYSYDALGRLVKVARAGTVNNNASACYAYDQANNRSNVTVSTTSDCSAPIAPSFSINNSSASEGGTVTFTVTRSGSTAGTDTVKYATGTDGTATSGTDYTAVPLTTLSFAPGVATKTVTVSTIEDSIVEANETFHVNLSSPSTGATISDGQGTGTINNDDSTPVCSGVTFTIASNGAVTEGTGSSFTITKHGTASGSCNVTYGTANGSATAGSDYTAASATLIFSRLQTSKTVTVTTTDDATVESAETFSMSLSSPTGGATLGSPSSATATINDNDVAPACSGVSFTVASNGAVAEGTNSVFTVTKSGTATGTCGVSYATSNGTATAGSDYTAASGSLTFTTAQTTQTISVTTAQDALTEGAETFSMSLSSPTFGAVLGTPSSATGTINNVAPNNPPTPVNDFATDFPCELKVVNVVANDTDPDGDYPLTVVSVNGTGFNISPPSSVSYQDDGSNPGGQVGATYVVQDSRGAQASATVTISIRTGQCP